VSAIAPHSPPAVEVWLSVFECAALLGISKWAVQKSARRGRYVTRLADGQRGGGLGGKVLQIALSSLPAHAQASWWASRPAPAPPAPPDPAPPAVSIAEVPSWKLAEAVRRAEILQWWRAFRAGLPPGTPATEAVSLFCAERGVSRSTLYSYLRAYKAAPERERLNFLLPRAHKNRNRSLALTGQMKCLVVSRYCREEQPFAQHIYEELSNFCQATGQYCPSVSTVRRTIQSIPPSVLCLSREGADAYKRKFGPVTRRDLNSLPVDAWWCIDHRQFDLLVYEDERHERMFRPWLTAIMDLRSRYFVGWSIGQIPNSTSISLALKNAIAQETTEDHVRGFLPRNLYMDDGKDYRSAYLHGKTWKWQDLGRVEASEEVKGVLHHLGITPVHALPYSPQSKPIEPNFRWIPFREERRLPGWTGNSEQRRPEKLGGEILRQELLTLPELISQFPAWLSDHHHHEHSGIGCTPAEARAAAGIQPVEIDRKAFWLLLMKSKPLTVHRDGVRPLGQNLSFWNDALGLHVNQKIQVRWDPADVSKVYCFTLGGDYICAANNIPLSQMGETTEAEYQAAASRRKAARKAVKGYVEEARIASGIIEAVKTVKRQPEAEEMPLRAVAGGEPMRMIGQMDHMAESMQGNKQPSKISFSSRGGRTTLELLDQAEALLKEKGDHDES